MTAARPEHRGGLKIFLGYAAGVGKTYKMLEEAQQLREQGRDIAVGYFEPHGRQETIAKLAGLEVVPRRLVPYRGCDFEEMDADAILARRPEICVVDELPHTNVPGSPRAKRWEDVVTLLDAGIDVLTTMNIQHLEGLNDHVREISGIQVRETVPDWIVEEASEIVAVDLTPQALLNRLARGVVYPMEKAAHAMENFFREPTLAALREMALRQAAHAVDARQSRLDVAERVGPGGRSRGIERGAGAHPDPHDRFAGHVRSHSTWPAGRRLFEGRLFCGRGRASRREAGDEACARRTLSRSTWRSRDDCTSTRAGFAPETWRRRSSTSRGATGSRRSWSRSPPRRSPWLFYRRATAMRVVELAKDMQVTVVAERRPATPAGSAGLKSPRAL